MAAPDYKGEDEHLTNRLAAVGLLGFIIVGVICYFYYFAQPSPRQAAVQNAVAAKNFPPNPYAASTTDTQRQRLLDRLGSH